MHTFRVTVFRSWELAEQTLDKLILAYGFNKAPPVDRTRQEHTTLEGSTARRVQLLIGYLDPPEAGQKHVFVSRFGLTWKMKSDHLASSS